MCMLCGNKNSTLDEMYEPFTIVCCPECGKYVISEDFCMNIIEHPDLAKRTKVAVQNANIIVPFLGNENAYKEYKKRNPNTRSVHIEII